MFSSVGNFQTTFQSGLCHFSFSPDPNENSCCSMSLPAFEIASFLHFSNFNWCVEVSHYCFNLQFLNEKPYWSSFHMLICHCVSSLVLRFFAHVLSGMLVFLLLNFKSSFCIVWIQVLYQKCVFQIFPLSVWLVVMCGLHTEEINFSIIAQNFPNQMR